MNKENTEKLFNRFEFFYPERPITEALMCFGFECGDGWFDLIWNLCEEIDKIKGPEFSVFQVKEKFGSLRFYTGGSNEENFEAIEKLIDEAENKSASICEKCGMPSEIKDDDFGWYASLCETCR